MHNVTGVFQGNRLIIVITQFDQVSGSAELSDTDEEITEETVKKQTCQFVHKACPGVKFSPDDVLLVSGRWAYHARMLAATPPHGPTQCAHDGFQARVKRLLRDVPNSTCGQGEDPNVSFDKLGDAELSAKLEEASGIATLEARYFKFHILLVYCIITLLKRITLQGRYPNHWASTTWFKQLAITYKKHTKTT